MLWLMTSDIYYYHNVEKLKQEHEVDTLLVMPDDRELREFMTNSTNVKSAVLTTHKPDKKFREFFVLHKLRNREGVLTTQQKALGVDESIALEQTLGLKIISPKNLIKLNDMSGMPRFISWAIQVEADIENGDFPKPAIFVGMAGCGKSRGAEAIAGEWGVPLIDLHIPTVLMNDNPFEMIDEIFTYFSENSQTQRFVVRMDEIEQMLTDKNMMGKLLTLFNDLNTPKGYKLNGILIATANNISELIEKVPQFFRHGRWSEKFLVSFPPVASAIEMMQYYYQMYGVNFVNIKEMENLQLNGKFITLNILIENEYEEYNKASNDGRFVYAPSEIDALMSFLSKMEVFSESDLIRAIKRIRPQQLTASKGTLEMYAKAKELSFVDIYDEA